MSSHYDTHPAAVKLRRAADTFGRNLRIEPVDQNDTVGRKLWRDLSRAAVAYAKLVLAGQCVPKEQERTVPHALPKDWYTRPCPKGCPPGRCNATDHDCVLLEGSHDD